MQVALLVTPDVEEKDLGENSDRNRCNACHGGRRQRRRHAAPTARLSTGSSRQDADRQDTRRQKPNRQVTGRNQELLIRAIGSGLGICQTGEGMSKRLNRLALCLLAGFCAAAVMPKCEIQSASAHEVHKRTVETHALDEAKPAHTARTPGSGSAKGSYYVDFRARTAASWGHAFVWYGRTGERQVEVAGLTPAGDSLDYVLGYVMRVPSETGASYGDLDPQT